jgi:cytochrome c peroxidase
MGESGSRIWGFRIGWAAAALAAAAVAGCGGDDGTATTELSLDERLSQLIADNGLEGSPKLSEDLTPPQLEIRELRRELGRNLFFDHALSGIEQTSCGTCHHAEFQFTDARNIARGVYCDVVPEISIVCHEAPPEGTGGNVVGPDRSSPLNSRNSPTIIDSALYPRQMWNGRFRFNDQHSTDVNECDASQGFRMSPLPEGDMFVRSLLTAQAHIPVTEIVEMTGNYPDFGSVPEEPDHLNAEVRDALAGRLDFIPAYRALFEEAYPADRPELRLSPHDPEVGPNDDLTYLAIGDALGHFMESLIMTDAPWDRYIQGDRTALSEAAKRGAVLFYENDRCSSCHEGDLFSDFQNYNIGVPQVGPGTARFSGEPGYGGLTNWDFGLEEITTLREDRFKFRAAPLRGVGLTSPYMHNGAYTELADAVRHHLDPAAAYAAYDLSQIEPDMQAFGLNPAGPVFADANLVVLGSGPGQKKISLGEAEIADVVEFLKALTDPRMLDVSDLAPDEVPSGLPIDVPGARRVTRYPDGRDEASRPSRKGRQH